MMVYICTKFHENILNGNRVMERTRKVNRRTDEGHEIVRLVFDGRIKIRNFGEGIPLNTCISFTIYKITQHHWTMNKVQ